MTAKGETENGNLLAVIVLTALMIVACAFITKTLWGWFIVPLGVRPIGPAHASGIGSVMVLFRRRSQQSEVPTLKDIWGHLGWYLGVLGIAWVEHWIMVRP